MEQPPPPERYRANAREVFVDYGVATVALIAWEIWCIRDGWFHPDPNYEHITFSRVMAYVSVPVLIFCVVMATSAGLTMRREKKNRSKS